MLFVRARSASAKAEPGSAVQLTTSLSAQTRPDKARSSPKLFAEIALEDLAALPANHSFVDGLNALIASAAMGSLARLIASANK
jgi:hypothetical protein